MIKKIDLKLRIIAILILVALSIPCVFPLKSNINLGLDLKGGMYVLLRADTSSIPSSEAADIISATVETLRKRIDIAGVKGIPIQTQGRDSILIQIPGVVDREIVDKLKGVGKLEFKLVEDNSEKMSLAKGGETPQGYELKKYKDSFLLLYEEPSLMGSDLSDSFVGFGEYNMPDVRLEFTSSGAKRFAKVTEENVGRRLAIILDDSVISAPSIRMPILNGEGVISGDFTMEEARLIMSVLKSGALPVPLSVAEERSVGPLLGSDSIRRGVNSIILGGALVVAFVLAYYFLGGIITVICLALNLLFILAGLNLFKGTLTLPGIAGMILTLGMAVDANVLIFERIREELKLNKPLGLAVKNGFNRAKRTIFDANITTLIAALFLLIFGTGPIRGFATTLSLGIVFSVFTSVFIGRALFSLFLDLKLKKFPMLALISSPKINFVKARVICISISLVVILVGMFNFFSKGEEAYGIDFTGGQISEYKITPPASMEELRSILKEEDFSNLTIQEFTDIPGGVSLGSKNDITSQLKQILKNNFDKVEELKVTTVGPAVGKILRKKAGLAIILSLLGILIYVGFRFKHFDFALAAVIALFHDILISLGFLCFGGFQINLLTITALLTIAGYSINDTIVIYDRIREISPHLHKKSLKEIINIAVNNTLSRTIITSFTTLMVVASIFFLGGKALEGFSFALLVGVIAGTYSSIYIASPLVLLFRRSRIRSK